MDRKLANQIIDEALNLAIQRGCYDLIAVVNIVSALKFLKEEQEMNLNFESFVPENKNIK